MSKQIVTVLALTLIAALLGGCKPPQTLVVDRTDAGRGRV